MPSLKIISSRKALLPLLEQLPKILIGHPTLPDAYWHLLEQEVLQHKVKFPILEFLAVEIYPTLNHPQLEALMTALAKARHISCYPVIGKLLQLQLKADVADTYAEAIEHIIAGDEWYACDIISERVFGEGALRSFDQSLTLFREMGRHDSIWIQRSIGIATHYATKKKLPEAQVEQLLLLMVAHGHKTQYFTKKGIGWAGKTIAKWHPDLIRKHEDEMKATKLSRWFVTKVNIGLSMAKAAPFDYERD